MTDVNFANKGLIIAPRIKIPPRIVETGTVQRIMGLTKIPRIPTVPKQEDIIGHTNTCAASVLDKSSGSFIFEKIEENCNV